MNKKLTGALLLPLSSLLMVNIASAVPPLAHYFQDPATAAWGGWSRGDPGTAHAYWDEIGTRGQPFDYDSSPDIADINNTSAIIIANNPGGFVTGTNNVYSFTDRPDWTLEIVPDYTLGTGTVTIALQLNVLGNLVDFNTVNLGLTDHTANFTSSEVLFLGAAGGAWGGSAQESLFVWENVPTASSYILNFLATYKHMSLDELAFDIGGFVPEGMPNGIIGPAIFTTSYSTHAAIDRFGIFINDGAALTLNHAATTDTLSIGQGISGSLLLTAANLIDDNAAVTVNAGATFNLQGNDDIIGSLAGAGNTILGAAAVLTTGGDDSSTIYSGVLSDSGSITKQGTGIMTLTGDNTYTGITTINDGTLLVQGSNRHSITTVNAGGTLGGTGTVGTVYIGGGIIAPGNSIGTINVDGNIDFSGGGVYRVEVDSAGNSDRINVTGTATLTSGIVQVLPQSGSYAQSTDYTILTAVGGLGGTTFASVSSSLAFLTPTLSYNANNVFLNLTRNTNTFITAANTPNQTAVATTLTSLAYSPDAGIQNLINDTLLLTELGAQQAFDSLSGVQHTHSQLLVQRLGHQFQRLLLNRGGQPVETHLVAFHSQPRVVDHLQSYLLVDNNDNSPNHAVAAVSPERGWWLQGFGGAGDINNTVNASGADYNTYGFAIGVDSEKRDFVIGIAGSYTTTKVETFGGNTDINSYQLGGYGQWQQDNIYINAAVGLGFHDMNASRNVVVGTTISTANADYDAWHVSAAIEAGKDFVFTRSSTILTPFVGLEYLYSKQDGFTETGADDTANLRVNDQEGDSLRAGLGLRLEQNITNHRDLQLTPYIDVVYVHEFMDTVSTLESAFSVAPTANFNVFGPQLDSNRILINAGIIEQLSENTHLHVAYNGDIAGSDEYHGFYMMLRFIW